MKKKFCGLLAVALALGLYGCGSTPSGTPDASPAADSPAPTEEVPSTETLTLAEKQSIEETVDFTLFKVFSSKKVTGSMGGGIYYENKNDGETYVDMILDWTNTSAETVRSDEIATVYAEGADGTRYERCLYVVETDNGTDVSQYESIAPLSTARLHCAVSVPESEEELTLHLLIGDKEYTYAYTMGKVDSTAKTIQLGDALGDESYATLTYVSMEYTDDVIPSNTSRSYTHYSIDNPDNTYLLVKFDVTNYQSTGKRCDTFIGLKARYLDKYTYTGSVVVEDTDGRGFSGYDNIEPLTTRHLYYKIEVPKAVTENPVQLTLSFAGQEYLING